MNKLLTLLGLALTLFVAHPALALTYSCSGPAVITGTLGLKSGAAPNPQYVIGGVPWAGPPAEAYSIGGYTNMGGPVKLSWGAASGAQVLTGAACATSGDGRGACGVPPAGRITTIRIDTSFDAAHVAISSFVLNGVKAAEVFGLGNTSSMQNTQTYSDGVSVIRPDTGANSRMYFEGWNTVSGVTTWKSAPAFFVSNTCGSISLNDANPDWRERFAFVERAREWWQTYG